MDIVSALLVLLGIGATLYGVGAYIKGIILEGTRPRMASWIAWCTANTVFTFAAISEGAEWAARLNGFSAATNLIIIGIGLGKAGSKLWPKDWIDWACLVSSIICVVVTVASPVKELGVITAMLANVIATIPTLRHAWSKPHEETWQFFAANVGAGSLSVIGVVMANGLSIGTIAGPLMITLGNASMLLITFCRRTTTPSQDGSEFNDEYPPIAKAQPQLQESSKA